MSILQNHHSLLSSRDFLMMKCWKNKENCSLKIQKITANQIPSICIPSPSVSNTATKRDSWKLGLLSGFGAVWFWLNFRMKWIRMVTLLIWFLCKVRNVYFSLMDLRFNGVKTVEVLPPFLTTLSSLKFPKACTDPLRWKTLQLNMRFQCVTSGSCLPGDMSWKPVVTVDT